MPAVSRIGDIGVGICCHPSHKGCIPMTGNLITGSSTVTTENALESRLGDIVLSNCGHIGIMISSSVTVVDESKGTVRIGDSFSGDFSGVLVTGADNTFAGD